MIIIVLLFCLALFILGFTYILISHALSSIFFFYPTEIEEKRITKAFDKAYESIPNTTQEKHLHNAEQRYRKFLFHKKEREAISLLNESKWVI